MKLNQPRSGGILVAPGVSPGITSQKDFQARFSERRTVVWFLSPNRSSHDQTHPGFNWTHSIPDL